MNQLLIVLMIAAGTLGLRASLVTILSGRELHPRLEQALSLVAPAILAGLVVQGLFLHHGSLGISLPWTIAIGLAAVMAWRFKSMALTLLVGMTTVWVLGLLL